MAASQYLEQVQEIYLAYYGRPADYEGYYFWADKLDKAGGNLDEIINAFGNSPEAVALYGDLTNTQRITAIYEQLFNRQPDAAGLNFYLAGLASGKMTLATVALDILNGASGADAVVLSYKMAAANAFTDEFSNGTNDIDQINAYAGEANANLAREWLAPVDDAATAQTAIAGIVPLLTVMQFGTPVDQTFVLTPGLDVLTGGAGDDQFLATQSTLNPGDRLNGGEGDDLLNVSISGSGVDLTSFDAVSIEGIQVKSLATGSSTIDLSDTLGVTTLTSYETNGADLTFRDIQSVNDTAVRIIDTDEDHTFVYDLNAYDPSALDVVDLTLQEARDTYDGEGNGPTITFRNPNGPSQIDGINIHSLSRAEAGPTPATANYVQDLNVGEDLDTIVIDGDADLEIEETLDRNVRVINAGALFADLTLDVASNTDTTGDGSADTFIYDGAHGRDNLDVSRTGNNNIALNDGNDRLDVDGNGNQSVTAGLGNDVVVLNGNGQDNVSLGDGNDALTINGVVDNWNTVAVRDGRSTVTGGTGNDNVDINGILVSQVLTAGNYTVDLGEGNDVLDIAGAGSHSVVAGAGNDAVRLNGNGSNNVQGNEGDDSILIIGNGNQTVVAGAGNDGVDIRGNGNQSVQGNEGNDAVAILGSGVHNVNLGAGDDALLIEGGRTSADNMDNAVNFNPTVIRGEGGNDTVNVTQDHYLDADLGEGNDSIQLRAKDLTADDTVVGGPGSDRIILTNVGASRVDGRVLQSETIGTTGFETYDLRDSNITLALTDLMIETAENKALTVDTTQATHQALPTLDLVGGGSVTPFHQGMTVLEFNAIAAGWWTGEYTQSPDNYSQDAAGLLAAKYDLVEWLLAQGLSVNFTDTTGDDDSLLIEPGDQFTLPSSENADQVWFILEQDGAQTIDMTPITTPQYNFTLLGGNIRDIVIGDDASINGRSILDFNSATGDALSAQDTLRVVDGAEITAADLRNVQGLERIELVSTGTAGPQEWTIQLTDIVINQTTGTADLVITVSPDVPAGSRVDIILDPSVEDATSDVKIFTNANADIYINGHRVTEPEIAAGTDWNPGARLIQVFNQLNFTANADNLVGTDGNDVFFAQSLDFIQAGDSADGNEGEDTLVLNFATTNDTASLQQQFNNANITEIEHLDFETARNVSFFGIGVNYMNDLREITTDVGDDNLTLRAGLTLNLEEGDDTVTFATAGASTVHGGLGEDAAYGSAGSDLIYVDSVEYIDGGNGNDTAVMLTNASDANDDFVEFWAVESVYGSGQSDRIRADVAGGTIYVDGSWGNDTIVVGGNTPNSAVVYGGWDSDSITVLATNTATVYGDYQGADVWDGNDTIAVTISGGSGSATALISGNGGNDNIRFVTPAAAQNYPAGGFWNGSYNDVTAQLSGGSGDDTIEAYVVGYNQSALTVDGGTGADSIHVVQHTDIYDAPMTAAVTGGSGNDTISYVTETGGTGAAVTIDGEANDDDISVTFGNAPGWTPLATGFDPTVNGGDGDDEITFSNSQPVSVTGTPVINGGTGNDSITVATDGWTTTITGAEGDDTIDLHVSTTSGQDTLVFGNITYNGLQVETLNTQGTDAIEGFNFEETGVVAGATDILNFQAFNGAFTSVSNSTTIGTADTLDTGVVNVLAAPSASYILTNANFATSGLTMANNSEGVLILAKDTDGQNGYDKFDVYFLQDVDSDAGVAVKVNLVGTIDSATNIGLASIDAANFV